MSEPSTESQPGNEPPALTPTAWAILGYLSLKSQSGYEILRAARESIAEFWGVSPGQLYPQLQNLAELGFIQAQGAAEGPRAKQQWSLTGASRQALQQWFAAPSEPLKIRDEASPTRMKPQSSAPRNSRCATARMPHGLPGTGPKTCSAKTLATGRNHERGDILE